MIFFQWHSLATFWSSISEQQQRQERETEGPQQTTNSKQQQQQQQQQQQEQQQEQQQQGCYCVKTFWIGADFSHACWVLFDVQKRFRSA